MNSWIKFFTSSHIIIYRLTSGLIGSRLGKQSILLLTTVGRRSGKKYNTTLSYYRDGNRYLVVASNWGKESQPDWYYNLITQPRATIQVRSKRIPAEAQPVRDDDYDRLWQLVTSQNEQYISYQKTLKRRIPIIVLTPADQGEPRS